MATPGLLTVAIDSVVSGLFIGRLFCVYPADAHYRSDPRVIVKPADGL